VVTERQGGEIASVPTVSAVVLAAGTSRRMGEANKLLLSVDGKPLLQQSIDTLTAVGVTQLIVVLGHQREALLEKIDFKDAISVFNSQFQDGQMSSVNCGLNAVDGKQDACMICLGDQPMIRAHHIQQLLQAFSERGERHIIVPEYDGQRGNPVLISEEVRLRVLADEQNPGCKRFIDANPTLVERLKVSDPAFVTDLDTLEEYRAYQQMPNGTTDLESSKVDGNAK